MKTTREELIDFVKWMNKSSITAQYEYIHPQAFVDTYLKSINSNAKNESLSVSDNEHQVKDFICTGCCEVCPEYKSILRGELCIKKIKSD